MSTSITRPAQTASYRPQIWGNRWAQLLDGKPVFTWLEVERMRLDPQVQFGLRILRAPLYGVTVKVQADDAVAERWIDREFRSIYNRMVPKMCRAFEYGVATGEVLYKSQTFRGRTRWRFKDFLERHPRDIELRIWKGDHRRAGELACLGVRNCEGAGQVWLDRRHGFWFKGEAEFGSWYGRPRLAGAHVPWFDKAGRHGGDDFAKLFYQKGAFRGPMLRYPLGKSRVESGETTVEIDNQQIAREIVEKFQTGGVLAIPGTRDEKGEYLWAWEDPKAFADVTGILAYPDSLDKKILKGLGIPPELVEASTVGSGYSGRAIPAQTFFRSMDEFAGLCVEALDRTILRPLVKLNFGPVAYSIVPDSLAKLVESQGQPGALPGAGPGGPTTPPAGGPAPWQGPRGGSGVFNPRTGKVDYHKRKPRIKLGHERPAEHNPKLGRLALLAMLEFQRRAHAVGDPEASRPYLEAVARLMADPAAARKAIRLGQRYDQPPPPKKFGCVMVQLPEAVSQRLIALGRQIPDGDLAEDGRETNPHVTALYGLHDADPEPVHRILAGTGPIRLRLTKPSVFLGSASGEDYDVVKIGVESPELVAVNQRLRALPHTLTHAEYRPHATIAYVKAGLGEKWAAALPPLNLDVDADSAVFSDARKVKTALRLGWQAVPYADGRTHRYQFKAVGDGPDAGRVLYGAEAERAIKAQQNRGAQAQDATQRAAQATGRPAPAPAEGEQPKTYSHKEWKALAADHQKKASEILTRFFGAGDDPTADDLRDLAEHLPFMSAARLSNARALLAEKYGRVKGWGSRVKAMRDSLMDHIRAQLDAQDKAAGAPPAVEPETPAEEPADVPGFGQGGKLFDRQEFEGDARPASVQAAHAALGEAARLVSGVSVPHSDKVDDYLKELAKLDEQVGRLIGEPPHVFGSMQDLVEYGKQDPGYHEPDEWAAVTYNRRQAAAALKRAGHPQLAELYSRFGGQLERELAAESHERAESQPQKPEPPATLEEFENRLRETAGDDPYEAYLNLASDTHPNVLREFANKHKVPKSDGGVRTHRTRVKAIQNFITGEQPAPAKKGRAAKPVAPPAPAAAPAAPPVPADTPLARPLHPDRKAKVDKTFEDTLGTADPARISAAVGASAGADVAIDLMHGHTGPMGRIVVRHPDYTAERWTGVDEDGKRYIENQECYVKEPGKGVGAAVFTRQVEHAAAAGVDYLKCHAGRRGDEALNGYYTWPRLGYDQPLDDPAIDDEDRPAYDAAKEAFPGAKTVLDVMSTKEGREWWKQHGADMPNARFDLAAGSRSRQILADYLREKAALNSPTSTTSTSEPSTPPSAAATPPIPARSPLATIDNGGKSNTISDSQEPPHENVARDGGGGDQGGLQPGRGLGVGAPSQPVAGEGAGAGARPGAVPPGADGQREGRVQSDAGRGDAAADGVGAGESRPARRRRRVGDPAPRNERGQLLGGGIDGSAPALPNPTPTEQTVSAPPHPENPTDVSAGNFRYAPDAEVFTQGGLKAKFNANLAAVRVLRGMQDEGRDVATPEEQAVLSKFTGWGQFPAVFNEFWESNWREEMRRRGMSEGEFRDERDKWANEREALRGLLTDEEWHAAKRSTLNAHYTHPDVVKMHWQLAKKLGFGGGRFLETSAGIGYYLGLMPPELAGKTHATAVELDPTTGGMLKSLYPKANVQVQGFQEHQHPPGYYDLVASNVPFGAYTVHDPKYNRFKAQIHDYFFLKSADAVRPGGLVMHITSTGTLDKADAKVRAELAKTCDLVGAIRFPGAAHKENAGTDVVTDMVILRKRLPGEEPGDQSWLETTTVPDPDGKDPIPVNRYFAERPEMVVGRLDRSGTMYRGDSANVSRTDDYEQRLAAAIDRLPANVMSSNRAPKQRFEPTVLPAPGEVKDGGFHVQDGKLFRRDGGASVEQKTSPDARKRIVGQLGVRDAWREVIRTERAGEDATAARAKLNAAYDAFVKAHGPLNDKKNRSLLEDDPDSPNLLALEKYDQKTKTAQKEDIFSKPTVSASKPVERVDTVAEGLHVSLHETGGLDVGYVAKLTGLTPEEAGRQLVAQGIGYEDPGHGWTHADRYLSGNVRQKLAAARAAAANDPRFQPNVDALLKVQPADVHHSEIGVKVGSPWLPPADVKEFAAQLLGSRPEAFDIGYNSQTGSWKANYSKHHSARWAQNGDAAKSVYGTPDVNFIEILEAAQNNQPVKVYMTDPNDPTGERRIIDPEKSAAAQAKVQELKDKFQEWVWKDDDRRARLHRYYNDNFNNIRNLKYSGAHLTLPGSNPAINLRANQKDFVHQVICTGKGLAAHEVGTGKTYTMIASAMELRRLGLAKKPAILCKKANVDAITKDARRLYPGAKILSTADMFDAKSRKATIAKIATGDYDMVVMTHDHFDLLGVKPETQQQFIRKELDEVEAAYEEAFADSGGDKGNRVVKQLAKAKESVEAKLQAALKAEAKDDAIHFEDTGIDQLFVDEAHRYKNLPIYTKMQGLKGVSTSASDRASNMYMKSQWLMERNGGRGVVFATGTPVSNSMGELYTMQRFLQGPELRERGVHSFDAWANNFGDVETKFEKTAKGTYEDVTRFSKFVNLPELLGISREMMDVVRADDLVLPNGEKEIKRPKRVDLVTAAPKTEAVDALMKSLEQRAADLKGKRPGESDDNMLAICTDGRKGSIDMRLLDAEAEDDPQSKTNQMVTNVLKQFREAPDKTQMIFSDMGANPVQSGFHLYGDIIDKLVAGGIPREKIADFTKLKDAKKDAAVEAMKRGDVLIGIGGTETLGTGVNAQDRLIALHHLDCPWRPADIEQRDGRGFRHGNANPKIHIHRYVTQGSLDEMFWQNVGRKARFIKQCVTPGTSAPREVTDEDTEELTPEQVMAAASGDERILKKVQLADDVRKLEYLERSHRLEQEGHKDRLKGATRRIADAEKESAAWGEVASHFAARPDFEMTVAGKKYNDREAATAALDEMLKDEYQTRYGQHAYKGMPLEKDYTDGWVLKAPNGRKLKVTPTLGSIETIARNRPKTNKEVADSTAAQARKDVAAVEGEIGKPFRHAETLQAKREEYDRLNKELAAESRKPKDES